ncbi:hypothetical protein GV819_06370 [Pseudomonas sp. Fl5BN2]|uniref:hypothetical protein n=1 Tax=unclassified Pseudomonas TaxID=196821 RepID=UPI0013777F12|nr:MULTISPECIES: hypothetical protein [unclassified Pseudomonas]NBF01912.1 hypothetical protein [Pseudomonas sp. Fl5BN2]NBF07404.1 hypothetical protein [Pseudomonas sp. Fl4BN1]
MNRRLYATALLLMLLCGCKQTYLTLHFQEEVGDPQQAEVASYFVETITQMATTIGIAADDIGLEMDRKDDKTLHISLDSSVSEPQRQRLRALLDEIVEARAAVTFDAVLEIAPQTGKYTSPDYRKRAMALPRHFSLALEPVQYASVMFQYSMQELISGKLSATGTPNEALCQYQASIRAPGMLFSQMGSKAGSGTGDYNVYLEWKGDKHEPEQYLFGNITFANPTLNQMLFDNRIQLSVIKTSWGSRDNRRADRIGFSVGGLGLQYHEDGEISALQHIGLMGRCTGMAMDLGRPFTFYIGRSMDRLLSVELASPNA